MPLDAMARRAFQAHYEDLVVHRVANKRPLPAPPAARLRGTVDYRELLEYLYVHIMTQPEFVQAKTVILITDNRDISMLPHWPHLARLLHERLRATLTDRWTSVFVPLDETIGLDQIHFTWGAVYVLEAIRAAHPDKHYTLMDHDACITT